jgi:hypothetical protein
MTPTDSIPPPTLPDPEQRARKDARKLLAGRRRRIRTMRRRVIAGSLTAFAAAWALIFFQLASGHDPALNKNSQAAAVHSSSSAANSPSAGNSSSTTPSQTLAPVTTQQS